MTSDFRWVDRLLAGYFGSTGLLLVGGVPGNPTYVWYVALHGLLALSLWGLSRWSPHAPALKALRYAYPLLLLGPLYVEADLFVRLLHDGQSLDALVAQWDRWLFGTHPHRILPALLQSAFWCACFHGLYLSYYALVVGCYAWTQWYRPEALSHFAFVLVGMYLSYILIFAAFPVAGPIAERSATFTTDHVLVRAVDRVYAASRADGVWTGAFPSSHVGISLGVFLLVCPLRRRSFCLLGAWVAGIAVSTVYGQFHYAIDAVAGVGSGAALYAAWDALYARLATRPTRRRPRLERAALGPEIKTN